MHVHTPPPRSRVPARLLRLRAALLAAALLALIPALTGCGLLGDDLGPDELPDEITSKHREQIQDTLERFFAGVDANNPQVAGEAMLSPSEVGIEEFARMVVVLGALQGAQVEWGFRSLGAAKFIAEPEVVEVTALTSLGPTMSVRLVRRSGEWRVATVPDLLPTQDRLPYSVRSEITNVYRKDDGALVAIGYIENTGDNVLLPMSSGVYLRPSGRTTARLEQSAAITDPFLHRGERTLIRADFPVGTDGSAADFEVIPVVRVASSSDEEVLATDLSVDPEGINPATAGDSQTVSVRNQEIESRMAMVVVAAFRADGTPVTFATSGAHEALGGVITAVQVPGLDAAALEAADAVNVSVWGWRPPT